MAETPTTDKVVIDKTGFNLKWDRDEDRIYETGTDMGVLFIKGETYTGDSSAEYGPAYAWNGLTSVNETSEGGEPNDVYADNIKYLSIPGNENAGFSIEAYTYPEQFEQCDGSVTLAGVHVAQQRRKKFGFAFRSRIGDENDDEKGYKIHIYYNCLAAPSERSYSTVNENPEAMTMSWDVSTTPQDVGVIGDISFRPSAHIIIDTRDYKTEEAQARLATVLNTLYGTPAVEADVQNNIEAAAAVPGKLLPIASIIEMLMPSGT